MSTTPATTTAATGAGLEGVVAGESEICYIDGYAGVLSYRGYNIHTLAENATFEEVVWLLWKGSLPKQSELDQLKKEIYESSEIPAPVIDFLKANLKGAPMDVLRTAVSMLGLYDPEAKDMSPEANQRKATRLMARTSLIVAGFGRMRTGEPLVSPDKDLSMAANFLYCLTGKKPDKVMEHVFDVALTLHADHELNASTFAARVTAATLSDIYSAVTSGIGALKGPLHGGANEEVIKMLLEVGTADKAVERVQEMFAKKIKIPGFGHRVYRTDDPRAKHLRVMSEDLGKSTGQEDLYLMSSRVEDLVKKEKKLNPNVDFYSASTYYSLGIPIDLFTPVFAVSRMSGWTAHVLEQYHNNRLIRPRAEYKGNPDGMAWIPMEAAKVDERAYYQESRATKPANLNCPYCRTQDTYDLQWLVQTKKDRLPGGADERDRAKFAKAQSYMVLLDNQTACKNPRCRRRFDVSGIKTMAFL